MDPKTLSDAKSALQLIGCIVLLLCVYQFAEWLWRGAAIIFKGLCEWVAERAAKGKGGHF